MQGLNKTKQSIMEINLKAIEQFKKFKNSGTYSRRLKKNLLTFHSTSTSQANIGFTYIKPNFASLHENDCKVHHSYSEAQAIIVTEDNATPSDLTPVDPVPEDTNTHTKVHTNMFDDYCSVSDDSDYYEDEYSRITRIRSDLRKWANLHNIKHTAINDLLAILNKTFDAKLPIDARTLMETPKNLTISTLANGKDQYYWHYGLEMCLRKCFNQITESIEIFININLDGLPIYKSSKLEFWPILFNVHNMPEFNPMVIGLFCGNGKPSSLSEYLDQFVEELNNILENGILINDIKINVRIRCFICDSPARAFLKGIRAHKLYFLCTICLKYYRCYQF